MMLVISLGSIFVAAIAVYLTTKIQDEVFKVGMTVVALVFALVTLVCAPWILKLCVVALPLLFGNSQNLSSY
jgi:hypothetical protein